MEPATPGRCDRSTVEAQVWTAGARRRAVSNTDASSWHQAHAKSRKTGLKIEPRGLVSRPSPGSSPEGRLTQPEDREGTESCVALSVGLSCGSSGRRRARSEPAGRRRARARFVRTAAPRRLVGQRGRRRAGWLDSAWVRMGGLFWRGARGIRTLRPPGRFGSCNVRFCDTAPVRQEPLSAPQAPLLPSAVLGNA